MFLSAPYIIPIEGPHLSPGAIRIQGDTIEAVGSIDLLKKKSPNETTIELDSQILLPGFVNGHCHLELTSLGPLSLPQRSRQTGFVSWIEEVVRRKNRLSREEIAQGIRTGIQKLMHSGVTTIGDHVSFNCEWEEITSSPLRGRLFGEVLGIVPEVCRDIYRTFKKIRKSINSTQSRFVMHISPHSVHAVHPEVFREILKAEDEPISIHLAESLAEQEYFTDKGGPLMELILSRGIASTHKEKSALDFIRGFDLPLTKILIVHGNYLNEDDLELVAQKSLSLVHSPGSHEYFDHRRFPLPRLLKLGINVAVGTDSIASNTDLDFLLELRRLKKNYPELPAGTTLTLATLNGAKALRMEHSVGSLIPGKKADIIGFSLQPGSSPEESVFRAPSTSFLMIDGKVIKKKNVHGVCSSA